MLMKSADNVSDFTVVSDGGNRRVSVFGMGWTGYTLGGGCSRIIVPDFDSFDDAEEIAEKAEAIAAEAEEIAAFAVYDDDLRKMAHYFYNLGRQHGVEATREEAGKAV
jgi:hypothetical protein